MGKRTEDARTGAEIKVTRVGRFTLTIKREFDNEGAYDLDWLGKWSNYREPQTKDQKLVHRATASVLDHSGVWRDIRGRLVPTPSRSNAPERNAYVYSWHDNGHTQGKHALQDSARMEAFNRGDLWMLWISAAVTLDGVEIASDSIGGIESDSGEAYIVEQEREVAHEAIKRTRQWLERHTNGLSRNTK